MRGESKRYVVGAKKRKYIPAYGGAFGGAIGRVVRVVPPAAVFEAKYGPRSEPLRAAIGTVHPSRARSVFQYTRRGALRRSIRRRTSIGPSFNAEEKAYIEAVTNPFGKKSLEGSYDQMLGARIPDPSGAKSLPVTLHCQGTINTQGDGTRAKGFLKICYPTSNDDTAVINYYNEEGKLSPGGEDGTDWKNWSSINTSVKKYRVVGMGLKLQTTSYGENVEGYLRGGIHTGNIENGASWFTYDAHTVQLENHVFPTLQGITVRWLPMDNADCEFADIGTSVLNGQSDWRAPVIFYDSVGTKCKMIFEAVLHLEVVLNQQTSAIPMTHSPISLKWDTVHALVTNPDLAPIVTKGNSFKSFFTRTGKIAGDIYGWLSRNKDTIHGIYKGVSSLL